MVDISGKRPSKRVAVASGYITMQASTLERITESQTPKGDVLAVARIAGIMAAKRAPDLIPLCHPLLLTSVEVKFEIERAQNAIKSIATVATEGQTGVEMEALTAVQVSLLTIFDMCKAVDRAMVMTDIAVDSKSGGKSAEWTRPGEKA